MKCNNYLMHHNAVSHRWLFQYSYLAMLAVKRDFSSMIDLTATHAIIVRFFRSGSKLNQARDSFVMDEITFKG
jgi:hypothetical protein